MDIDADDHGEERIPFLGMDAHFISTEKKRETMNWIRHGQITGS